MMSLNRYRLRHLAKNGNRSAQKAENLLANTDRLIGVILLGNNFVNIAASSIATVLALEYFGESGIAVATGLMTLVVLIFAEVAPKTLAANYPEQIALPMSWVLEPLLKLLYPIVYLVNLITNGFWRIFGIKKKGSKLTHLNAEELKTLVDETGDGIGHQYKEMLSGVLDLDKATVAEVMVPRSEILGIDVESGMEAVMQIIQTTAYTRIPVYQGNLNQILGILHLRHIIPLLRQPSFTLEDLLAICTEPYYVPENTSLKIQLHQFQNRGERLAMVVDEYGDIQGLLTLDDLLEEIIGDFTSTEDDDYVGIETLEQDIYRIDASESIRDINKALGISLPIDTAKTLNGLILAALEHVPEVGEWFNLDRYSFQILETTETSVEVVKLHILPSEEDSDT